MRLTRFYCAPTERLDKHRSHHRLFERSTASGTGGTESAGTASNQASMAKPPPVRTIVAPRNIFFLQRFRHRTPVGLRGFLFPCRGFFLPGLLGFFLLFL